jgi:hypothetical protein
MLLSINEAKVEEVLKSSATEFSGYRVELVQPVITNSSFVPKPNPKYPEVAEAFYTAPVLVTAETKERLTSVRRRIEESGVPLKTAENLSREIDEMRGRR